MPYPPEHKAETRAKIVEGARRLFNRRGFDEVSIDEIMASVGLTRGGFYNHFPNKEVLYGEAIASYARADPSSTWQDVELDPTAPSQEFALQFLNAYLSPQHLGDTAFHCPMIALPSDAARAGSAARQAYEKLFRAMVGVFEASLKGEAALCRQKAVTMATLCVGGMVVARTLDDEAFATEIREAARTLALDLSGLEGERAPGD